MKKSKAIIIAVMIIAAVFLLSGCNKSPRKVTTWAHNLKAEDIVSATTRTSLPDSESFQLSDAEIQEIVSHINSLLEYDFHLNKDAFRPSAPEFTLSLTTSDGEYRIEQSTWPMYELEIEFNGKLWWFSCKELEELILEKTGWVPEVIWSGQVSSSNLTTYIRNGDDVASNSSQVPQCPIAKVLTGTVDNIASVSVDHTDGRAVLLDDPQLHEIVTTLDSMEQKNILLPHHFYSNREGIKFTITIEYENSSTDVIFFKEEAFYSHPVLGLYAPSRGLGFSIDSDGEFYSMLEEVLNN